MKPILVTYATMAGSTADVAAAVAEEIERAGRPVELRPLAEVDDVSAYAAVVVGGPMILGWHRGALAFLRRHRRAWQHVPLAVFVTALSLTATAEREIDGVPIALDEKLPKPPAMPGKLSFRERYAQLGRYVRPILRAAGPARPAGVGVFGGRMEYGRLKWWAVLFAMTIVNAPAGDRRNWAAIRAWAAELPGLLMEEEENPQISQIAQM